MKKGLIFDIKRYAIHDGPGIRTTIFLKGCPLRCLWCANPESQKISKEFIFWPERCLKCGECMRACKLDAIGGDDNGRTVDDGRCNFCGDCTQACYPGALQVIGREITLKKLLNEIEKDRVFYSDSNGGVTFSGGEPFLQSEFLHEILKACKERGLHTTVDTCGFVEWKNFEKVKGLVDLYLFDIKLIEEKKHKRHTGVFNSLILSNLEKLVKHHRVIVRIPLVPRVNDGVDDIRRLGKYLSRIREIQEINLLPYHRLAMSKYQRLNWDYKLGDIKPPTRKRMREIHQVFRDFGLNTTIGG